MTIEIQVLRYQKCLFWLVWISSLIWHLSFGICHFLAS
jgi:hypothetical protein